MSRDYGEVDYHYRCETCGDEVALPVHPHEPDTPFCGKDRRHGRMTCVSSGS